MIVPLAQASPNPLIAALAATVIILPLGIVIGYLWARRFKRQYLRVARELANLRGENFRGELSQIGMPRGTGMRVGSAAEDGQGLLRDTIAERTAERDRLAAELAESQQHADRLQQQVDELTAEQEASRRGASEPSAAAPSQGTEAWQLAQLHKEQIAMQLKMDDYAQQIRQLTQQREHWQSQADASAAEFQHLRQLLAQQEAVIASVERERDSLATRLVELEQHSRRSGSA